MDLHGGFRARRGTQSTMSDESLPPPPQPSTPTPQPNDDRVLALVAHLAGPFLPVVVALIVWLTRREQSPFLDQHGKEALNFQLASLVVSTAVGISALFTCGLTGVLLPPLWLVQLVFAILASVKANEGQPYRYPVSLRLIS